jgi:hypothetical protein
MRCPGPPYPPCALPSLQGGADGCRPFWRPWWLHPEGPAPHRAAVACLRAPIPIQSAEHDRRAGASGLGGPDRAGARALDRGSTFSTKNTAGTSPVPWQPFDRGIQRGSLSLAQRRASSADTTRRVAGFAPMGGTSDQGCIEPSSRCSIPDASCERGRWHSLPPNGTAQEPSVSNRPRFTNHSGHTKIPPGMGALDPRQTAAFR